MHDRKAILPQLEVQKLLPLYYHENAEVSIAIMQALYEGGIRLIEYTNRGEHALRNFVALKKTAQNLPGMQIGIGTIKNEAAAKAFIEAGADFIICPIVNTAVASVTHAAGLLWIPGCMTPTEIAVAEEAGAAVVKIFPGGILGPAYIKAIKELFPGLRFMPTGGVSADAANLKEWFGAGVVAVGMGSNLITKDVTQGGDYNTLKEKTKSAIQLVQEASAPLT